MYYQHTKNVAAPLLYSSSNLLPSIRMRCQITVISNGYLWWFYDDDYVVANNDEIFSAGSLKWLLRSEWLPIQLFLPRKLAVNCQRHHKRDKSIKLSFLHTFHSAEKMPTQFHWSMKKVKWKQINRIQWKQWQATKWCC